MNFIDHTGHIFSSKSYSSNPIGYEYEETPYVFWFNTEYGYKLSINTYYFQNIRLLFKVPDEYTFGEGIYANDFIHIDAQDESIIKIMGSKQLQNILKDSETFLGNFNFYEYDGIIYDKEKIWDEQKQEWVLPADAKELFVKHLENKDLYILNDIQHTNYSYYEEEYYVYADGSAGEYTGEIHFESNGKPFGFVQIADVTEKVNLNTKTRKIIIDDESLIINGKYNDKDVKTSVEHYIVVPFYAIINSPNDGVWESNLLIHSSIAGFEEYCPITLGAEIVNECEELIINGHNMGVNLPKQIIKAVYSSSYYNDYPDERTYANKLKEYLINQSLIKGQTGNMRSAIAGLKWFGWSDKINLYQLLKTDNQFQLTYVRDAFDIQNDTIFTFNNFRLTTLISLGVKLNEEGNETQFDIYEKDENGHIIIIDGKPVHKNHFWGELKPEMINLLDKVIKIVYDETEIGFYRGYFDFCFQELGLKLCALKYYYKKYFLPIHLGENTVSLEHQCFMNDIKYMVRPHNIISADPLFTNGYKQNNDYTIEFPTLHTLFFNSEVHYVDTNYCEFGGTKESGENNNDDIYYINDTLISVPIKFIQEKEEQYYNCILLLQKDDVLVHEAHFSFVQNKTVEHKDTWFKNFIIHPKTLNTVLTGEKIEKYDINFWLESSYTIYLCVNNIWYSYDFKMAVPELSIELGKLKYQYYLEASNNYTKTNGLKTNFNQISGFGPNNKYIKFNNFMFQPDLVSTTNADFIENILAYAEDKNLVYLDSSQLSIGSFYYYLEYDNVKYIFSDSQNKLLKENADNILTIVDNKDTEITYCGNGTYSILFRKKKTKVINLTLQTNLFQNLESYVNTNYTQENNFVDNKYLNQVHLIDLYDEDWNPITFDIDTRSSVLGTMILGLSKLGNDVAKYGVKIDYYYSINNFASTIYTYKQFFNDKGESIFDIPIKYSSNIKTKLYEGDVLNNKLNKTKDISYDFYLMHDEERWHVILISKNTVDTMVEKDLEFTFPDHINTLTIGAQGYVWGYNDTDEKLTSGKSFLRINDYSNSSYTPHKTYYLVFNRSDKNILLNRLNYEKVNGINHFDKGDMISCTLINNDKLPFKLTNGSKWVFTPTSVGMSKESEVTSQTEMAIVSIGNTNSKYDCGYYDVTCNYTLDDFAQHSFTKKAKFRVNKT